MYRGAATAAVTVAVAGLAASVALAKGGTQVGVPTPAVGKGSIELVTVKLSGPKSGRPTLKVGNLAALGKGFGGVAVVQSKGKTFKAYLVLFMGNLSTSPASTINLQVTPPAGDTASAEKPTNATGSCKAVEGLSQLAEAMASKAFLEPLDKSGSHPSAFLQSMFGFMCP